MKSELAHHLDKGKANFFVGFVGSRSISAFANRLSLMDTQRRTFTKSIRRFEWLLLYCGLLLLMVYGAARIYGLASSRAAVREFWREQKSAAIRTQTGIPDFRLWSPKRVSAYQETIAGDFTAPLGVLKVSSIELEVPVFEGTDEATLNRGVGHIEGTTVPGEWGNVGIAGHRDGFFRGLKDIHVGDAIDLYTEKGYVRFHVDEMVIVRPESVEVLGPRTKPSLTLVTCYPFYFVGSASLRFVVHASMDQPPTRDTNGR
jgi:sortase A